MKNIFRYTIVIFSIILCVSCNDLLEEVPLSTLTNENVFQTETDGIAAVNGMYHGLTGSIRDGNWAVLYSLYGWGSQGTDIWTTSNTGIRSKFSRYVLSSVEDQVINNWSALYQTINRANTVIQQVGKIDAQQETIDALMAEAYFIRAFAYMDLVQFYGGVPLRLTPTSSIEKDLGAPRATEKAVWEQIIADFEFAENKLPDTNLPGRATKWAAKGLLAKAYLTRGGYPVGNYQESEWFEKAAAKSYEVISESGKLLNPTSPGSDGAFEEYGRQFTAPGENSPESIFELQFSGPDAGGAWGWLSTSGQLSLEETNYGSYFNFWGQTLVGSDFALSFNDNDIRFQWSIAPYTAIGGKRQIRALGLYFPYKYRLTERPPEPWGNSTNAVVLRMADVYLIYAEASNEATGDPNSSQFGMSAYEAINEVRIRAQITPLDDAYLNTESPYSSIDLLYNMSFDSFNKANENYNGRHVYYTGALQERFRSAVLMERAWELCFERHRWFDLKRTGRLLEFAGKARILNGGRLKSVEDPIDKSELESASQIPSYGKSVWPPSAIQPHNIYMPIPDVEIRINPELSEADQNPGY